MYQQYHLAAKQPNNRLFLNNKQRNKQDQINSANSAFILINCLISQGFQSGSIGPGNPGGLSGPGGPSGGPGGLGGPDGSGGQVVQVFQMVRGVRMVKLVRWSAGQVVRWSGGPGGQVGGQG